MTKNSYNMETVLGMLHINLISILRANENQMTQDELDVFNIMISEIKDLHNFRVEQATITGF